MSAGVAHDVTHVAVLTAAGRSAVAVIAVSGPAAVTAVNRFFQAANGRPLRRQPLNRIVYGHWGEARGEDVIVCRREASIVEIHCHGGTPSIQQIVGHLTSAGCVSIDWRQWLASQSVCPLAAEAKAALAEACTLRSATILLDQYHGALRKKLSEIRFWLRDGSKQDAGDQLRGLLQYAQLGQHLTRPWRVVLAGLPNVGKSSLINALVGYPRSIVFDQPGTTHDVVSATTAADGWPIQLSDTPGLHQDVERLERAGISQAHQMIEEADLVVWVLEASSIDAGEEDSLREIVFRQSAEAEAIFNKVRTLVVVNKIDLWHGAAAFESGTLTTCAISSEGIAALLDAIATGLVPQVPPAGGAVPFTVRQIVLLQQALQLWQRGRREEAGALLENLLSQTAS